MSDSLSTYLHDHMAGANFAVELLEYLRDHHTGRPVASFAVRILSEIEEDRKSLQQVIESVGGHGSILKEATAWVGEKFSRLKLNQGAFGTFEALETLSLGVEGKRCLWRALNELSASDARLKAFDFAKLIASAEDQRARVEEQRLQTAREAFASQSS